MTQYERVVNYYVNNPWMTHDRDTIPESNITDLTTRRFEKNFSTIIYKMRNVRPTRDVSLSINNCL